MIETKETTSSVDQITEYVDAYLTKAAVARHCEKQRLCIWMYLTLNKEKPNLLNLLYEDNRVFINYITIKQVVTGFASMFSGMIERSIVDGFLKYAAETKFNAMHLKLRIYYKEGKLVYQVHYQDKPIAVDIENFFKK